MNHTDECTLMKQELTGDNRKWLVHPKVIKVVKEDLIKHQLKWILSDVTNINGDTIDVNDSELTVLSYVYLYGFDAIDKCVKDGHYSSSKTVENCISKFRNKKNGPLIQGTRENTKLHKGIKLSEGNISLTVKYKLNE